MTAIDHVRPRTSSRETALAGGRRPSVELMSEGVVAAYLHDISTRHPRPPRVRVPNVSISGRVDSHARGSRFGWASMSRRITGSASARCARAAASAAIRGR